MEKPPCVIRGSIYPLVPPPPNPEDQNLNYRYHYLGHQNLNSIIAHLIDDARSQIFNHQAISESHFKS